MTRKELIASAIVNARGGRRGAPPIINVLDVLPARLREQVLDDAQAVEDSLDGRPLEAGGPFVELHAVVREALAENRGRDIDAIATGIVRSISSHRARPALRYVAEVAPLEA